MNLKELRKEIPYKWRIGPGNTKLAYIDARDAMDLLDEVVGPESWQDSYELVGDKIIARVGIKVGEGWVWKSDTGTESNIEEEKGLFSDAFKRACVKWGVGRFLYDIKPDKETAVPTKSWEGAKATDKQLAWVDKKLRAVDHVFTPAQLKILTAKQASDFIGNKIDAKEVVRILMSKEVK